MLNSSILPIDKTLSGVTTPGRNGPGSNGIERVLYIPQIYKARTLPSDYFMSYPGHSLMQSVYSTAPANWAAQEAWSY